MLPDRVSNPGPLTYQSGPYRLHYAAQEAFSNIYLKELHNDKAVFCQFSVCLLCRPDMTVDVYHGRKTTTQQQQLYVLITIRYNLQALNT